MKTDFLVDTSAIARLLRDIDLRLRWSRRLSMGLMSYCDITLLEIGQSSRSVTTHEDLVKEMDELFLWVPMPDRVFHRALHVQDKLVDIGHHRGPGAADLLLAATAEAHSLTLLHYDAGFETIAKVTGQPTQWVAPRGSVD